MADKEEMITQILNIVRGDPSLWPKEYSKADSENFLAIIDDLVGPSLSSRGFPIPEEHFNQAKQWAQEVMEIYIKKNPFQGAFVRPFAEEMFTALDKIWKKRSSINPNGSSL